MRMVSPDLLRYSINNIQIQQHITHATISARTNIPTHKSHTTPAKLTQRTESAQFRQDSSAFWESIGLKKWATFARERAEAGRQAALDYCATRTSDAEYLGNIAEGATVQQLYAQKNMSDYMDDGTLVVKRAAHIDISFTKPSYEGHFTPMKIDFTWDVAKARQRYTPPDYSHTLTPRFASVDFTYIGPPRLAAPQMARKTLNILV